VRLPFGHQRLRNALQAHAARALHKHRIPLAQQHTKQFSSRLGVWHRMGLSCERLPRHRRGQRTDRYEHLDTAGRRMLGHLAVQGRLPAPDTIVAVSGRVSYEIVQKAAVAGIPVLCAVSAPSSLAVDAARRVGQTVVGFLRGDRFNVYTNPDRLDLER